MSTEVYEVDYYHPKYTENINRLVRKKKFHKLPKQLLELVEEFEKGNLQGKVIIHSDDPLYDVYKMRLANMDTNSGKSNGYRVIYLARRDKLTVAFLLIYYKKELETIAEDYIKSMIDDYFLFLLPSNDELEDLESGLIK